MYTFVYLLKWCPTKKLKNIKPKKFWSGFTPNISYLMVVGSVAYRRVLDQLINKLDEKGEQMMLVGYHSNEWLQTL